MENTNSGSSWIVQSFGALLLLIPAWLSIGFFSRNFQVKPDIFLLLYMLGIVITLASFKWISQELTLPPPKIAGVILIIGMTVGALANILIFRAVDGAPNPGLALSITNTTSVGVYLVAIALCAKLLQLREV